MDDDEDDADAAADDAGQFAQRSDGDGADQVEVVLRKMRGRDSAAGRGYIRPKMLAVQVRRANCPGCGVGRCTWLWC